MNATTTAGGFTHVFKKKVLNGMLDSLHWRVQRPNSILRKLFDYVSDNKLKWDDMGDIYDSIIIGRKDLIS